MNEGIAPFKDNMLHVKYWLFGRHNYSFCSFTS